MTQRSSPVETSLLYLTESAPIQQVDVSALRTLLSMLDLTPAKIRVHKQDYIYIDCGALEAVIVGCDVAFPADHFEGSDFPGPQTEDGAFIRAALDRHVSSLTVIVVDKHSTPGHIPDADLNCRIGWHLLYLLTEMTHPEIVFWCEDDRLMTPPMATEAIRAFHRACPFAFASKGQSDAPSTAGKQHKTADLHCPPMPSVPSVQFAQQPELSSDVLHWFTRPATDEETQDQACQQTQASRPAGVSEWLRHLSTTSRAAIGLSAASVTIGVFGLPYKASAALGKLF